MKKTCLYYFCLRCLIDERTNIATYAITNNATELDIYYLLEDNLPLSSEDEKKNEDTNKSKNDILFKEELTTIGANLQPKISDLPRFIDRNLDSTLFNPYITATNLITYGQEPQKIKSNTNKRSNTGSHISAINDLDLSSHNSEKGSFSRKRGLKNIFTSLELVNEVI